MIASNKMPPVEYSQVGEIVPLRNAKTDFYRMVLSFVRHSHTRITSCRQCTYSKHRVENCLYNGLTSNLIAFRCFT